MQNTAGVFAAAFLDISVLGKSVLDSLYYIIENYSSCNGNFQAISVVVRREI